MPRLHHKTFSAHVKAVHAKLPEFKADIRQSAMNAVRRELRHCDDSLLDVNTSYDGSWQTRGHKSMNGLGCVIENKTGLCVDYHTMSRFCQVCATTGAKLKAKSEVEWQRWWVSHKETCQINHTGSAGSMEKDAAITMWGRSIEFNNARYVSMTSDGDTKTIEALLESKPYGWF